MEKKNALSFTLIVVAIILGVSLWRQFDVETFRFEKPALAVIYLIVFAASVFILIKNAVSKNGR
ncbi:hypothetical protein DJ568_15575 [Mucilaginibacter hurinus]|uniref:ATP synthase F0 sector subunit C n=1 Tax=Mucilaginibacter hurinus TaxID=2201324 RepID=A0A367GLS7_9SPHI|nr:hypothetical protein [Mucilaginibacter hurinus]RCH53958.1 hypothetical protein DJ568_15575 [Mucilaginibacter hurinus]